MNILIATGIYPPEIGGPATYAKHLAESLKKSRYAVKVITFSNKRKFPTGIRHIIFLVELLFKSFDADAVIALDTFSVAVPAGYVAKITRTPLLVRVGGDFLWEQYVNRTNERILLPFFYKGERKFSLKERAIFCLTTTMFRRAALVVFTNDWMRKLYAPPYNISLEKTAIIENAIEEKLSSIQPQKKNYLWYTRNIPLKNGRKLRRAFKAAQKETQDIVLEDGHVSYEELIEKIRRCYGLILPSLSEVSPNYILDALRCGKPFILTKYSGYAKKYGKYGLLVDPLDEGDIKEKILELSRPEVYMSLREKILSFDQIHTYDEIAEEYISLIMGKL